jgi:hypothetical protein
MNVTEEQDNTPRYSDMIKEVIGKYQDLLPEELSLEETLIIGMDAWNLASRKATENDEGLFNAALADRKYPEIADKMIQYKLEKFADYDHLIIDFKVVDGDLKVQHQSQKDHLREMMSDMLNAQHKDKKYKK